MVCERAKAPAFASDARAGRQEGDGRQFSFGIEEEYFLAHADTFDVAGRAPQTLFEEAATVTGGRATHESLQAQIEVSTPPLTETASAADALADLRGKVAAVAKRYGMALLASGTHPTAEWTDISPTASRRYDKVMDALQIVGQRNMFCGMHVHVALPDPDRRVEIMGKLVPYVPLFLALSTSSPFWRGHNTGLKSYRLAAYDELPRSGMPEVFSCARDYDDYVNALVNAGSISDSSFIWWMVRPSRKYPTLELRAADCCTRVSDALAIACLYRALVRRLYRQGEAPQREAHLLRALATESKWQAQRYGVFATFPTRLGPITVRQMLEDVLSDTVEDAHALHCADEIATCRTIIDRGTSADMQLHVFEANRDRGQKSALNEVASWIAQSSLVSVK